jgi:hypothetical protein
MSHQDRPSAKYVQAPAGERVICARFGAPLEHVSGYRHEHTGVSIRDRADRTRVR